MIFIAIF